MSEGDGLGGWGRCRAQGHCPHGLCPHEAGALGRGAEQGWPRPESHRVTRLCLESDGSRARAEAGTRPEATAPVQA